ncbi:RAMP superfamily CRISPR-associated protein [Oribacterium sp. FC2011]|uniref:RAMP superfamily CRISPR-associated protein n=1 Tax=Oribacterium sp. FC2011 TaxID=1408311 RepID=UPI0004E1DDB1|nr:RAMP superfamily CRISPR-associated protein [Oribacterium sp. FC2011]
MKYLRIQLKNIEPLRISDDSVSQSGQTETLTFIPGSSMRGALIAEIIKNEKMKGAEELQKSIDEILSDKVSFINAYPSSYSSDGIKELIPSVKGFYEDKQEVKGKKPIENVLKTGEVEEGKKRAGLGRYCYPDGDTIKYLSNFNLEADLKINIGREAGIKKNVFRIQYIPSGRIFTGYIKVEDEVLFDKIKDTLSRIKEHDSLYLGNGKWSGLGHTEIIDIKECDSTDAETFAESGNLKAPQYMMLLSHGTMLNQYGENVGIDISSLETALGIKNLKIALASSSVVDVRGFNRTWKTHVPSVKMYEMGSMFKLEFDGEIQKDRVKKLYDDGIGIRKNEGFGRVIFVKNYDDIKFKEAFRIEERNTGIEHSKDTELTADDRSTLKVAAKGILRKKLNSALMDYINSNPLNFGKLKRSQIGTIRSIASLNQFNPDEAVKQLKDYMEHSEKKADDMKVFSGTKDVKSLNKQIRTVINNDVPEILFGTKGQETILGIPVKDIYDETEWKQFRIQMLLEMIDHSNRKEKYNG